MLHGHPFTIAATYPRLILRWPWSCSSCDKYVFTSISANADKSKSGNASLGFLITSPRESRLFTCVFETGKLTIGVQDRDVTLR